VSLQTSRLTPSDARSILRESGATVGGNFFALGQSTVETLLAYADAHRYRQSRHAKPALPMVRACRLTFDALHCASAKVEAHS
jgi:hypothetical protein